MRSVLLPLLLVLQPLTVTPSPKQDSLQIVSRVKTEDPVVFVTIDDGSFRPRAAADFLEQAGWPVTSFVVPRALRKDPGYFQNLGSRSEFANHTRNHPDLTKLGLKAQKHEICTARDEIKAVVGSHTTFFRPPYGRYNPTTLRAARECGMTRVVLWRVTVSNGVISTWGKSKITKGDIILLHYLPSLQKSLKALDAELRKLGLKPALLSSYLGR